MPYFIQLLGEYVIDIIDVIAKHIHLINREITNKFIEGNLNFFELTKKRVISYWNAYYRDLYPNFEDYIGYQVLMKIDKFRPIDESCG